MQWPKTKMALMCGGEGDDVLKVNFKFIKINILQGFSLE